MKTKLCLTFLVVTFFLWSCQNEEYSDPNYPTIVRALSEQALNQVLGQIAQTPFAEYTALDTFGIPLMVANYDDSLNNTGWRYSVTKEELKQLAKEAIAEYGYFLNVTDSSKIGIQSITTTANMKYDLFKDTYPDSLPPAWKVTTAQQVHEGIEVRGTSLSLVFSPYGLVTCSGHWYSEIYIPDSLVYTEETAMELIMNKALSYKNSKLTINEETSWRKAKQVILPIRRSGEIELRFCWALFPESWEILFDTQTGEILSTIDIAKL